MSDRLELHRLFTNLVGNAIKFTDAGAVTIRLKPTSDPTTAPRNEQSVYITIEVEDTGPSSLLKNKPPCLKDFAREAMRSGSGLGLYLSRRSRSPSRHH